MRILFITPNYPVSSDSYKGIFIKELAEAINESGCEIRVVHLHSKIIWPLSLINRYKFNPDSNLLSPIPLIKYSITVFPGAIGMISMANMWGRQLYKILRKTWNDFNPDIIHAHSFIPGALVGKKISEFYKCPLVVTTHGADTRVWLHRYGGKRVIRDLCNNQTTAITCVSKTVKNLLSQSQISTNKCEVIPNGMDMKKIFSGINSVRKRYVDKLLILGIGNLIRSKGFDLFIQAFQLLRQKNRQIHGIIIGDGPEKDNLQKLIRQFHLENDVELTGAKSPKGTMEYMDACDIFCLPSWSEGFGMVYLEALAHRKPVIAVEGQGIADIIKHGEAGYCIKPGNLKELLNYLQSLIDDPDKRNRMGLRGQMLVENNYTWKHCSHQYINIYSSILG